MIVSHDFRLISQVAEELWEVADKTIRNLTKEDISIVDYKRNLVKHSTVFTPPSFYRVLIVMQARLNWKRPSSSARLPLKARRSECPSPISCVHPSVCACRTLRPLHGPHTSCHCSRISFSFDCCTTSWILHLYVCHVQGHVFTFRCFIDDVPTYRSRALRPRNEAHV